MNNKTLIKTVVIAVMKCRIIAGNHSSERLDNVKGQHNTDIYSTHTAVQDRELWAAVNLLLVVEQQWTPGLPIPLSEDTRTM